MNITHEYDINKIENDFLEITFSNESNIKHIDSIKVPRNDNGDIDQVELNNKIDELVQRVNNKKNFIFQ